ncbi:hypothetical protein ACFVTC_42470 [Streptomyces sp. NPDC057950]|uniref:hypothetical protein n=1 Tax=Streptomyces sp. NPDC057950 TaxID=3346288 RepID=UPI0036F17D73
MSRPSGRGRRHDTLGVVAAQTPSELYRAAAQSDEMLGRLALGVDGSALVAGTR